MENSMEDFWGVCLDSKQKTFEWDGNDLSDLGDEADVNDVEQTLELRQACLGVNPKDERNIVNVTAENGAGERITQTILSMKMGLHEQTQLFLTLYPPVTLELVSGSGPVYISGTVTTKLGSESDLDDDMDDEEEEEEEIENNESSVSPAVNKTLGKKRPADSPVQKPAKAVKVEKKDDKVAPTGLKSKKPAQEDDEDEEDEEDDEDMEEDEGESEEEESEEEEVTVQTKTKKQTKAGGAQKKMQVPTTPKSGGTAVAKESGKKPAKEAMSIDDVKDKLLKTPTIPKKIDKFNNYITNSYKITDDKVKKQLWEFVQKNRPQS